MAMETLRSEFAVVGDCHGHLQLALGMLARWQDVTGARFDAVFLAGDVGTFTDDAQLDNATRRHAKDNPCELEFLHQWSTDPPAPWLDRIFQPKDAGGLGLTCPVIMVHGNHEGFAHLETLARTAIPSEPVALAGLPGVDPRDRIRLLPSGWRVVLPSGHLLAGVGGIEGREDRGYHPMAYLDEGAVLHLLDMGRVAFLVTHQGPSGVQGAKGSEALQALLDAGTARYWFHGHSVPNPDPVRAGPAGSTLVVPLGDIAFPGRGPSADEPGQDGWALAAIGPDGAVTVRKEVPPVWREFRRNKWTRTPEGQLICPPLARPLPRG
jgi:hypothetical protein